MRRQPQWWSLMAVFLSVIIVGIISIVYANQVSKEQARSICPLVNTLHEAYGSAPNLSPAGKKIAMDVAALKKRLSC